MKMKRHLKQFPKYKDFGPGIIAIVPRNRSAKRLAAYNSIPSVVCISGNGVDIWGDSRIVSIFEKGMKNFKQ